MHTTKQFQSVQQVLRSQFYVMLFRNAKRVHTNFVVCLLNKRYGQPGPLDQVLSKDRIVFITVKYYKYKKWMC